MLGKGPVLALGDGSNATRSMTCVGIVLVSMVSDSLNLSARVTDVV